MTSQEFQEAVKLAKDCPINKEQIQSICNALLWAATNDMAELKVAKSSLDMASSMLMSLRVSVIAGNEDGPGKEIDELNRITTEIEKIEKSIKYCKPRKLEIQVPTV